MEYIDAVDAGEYDPIIFRKAPNGCVEWRRILNRGNADGWEQYGCGAKLAQLRSKLVCLLARTRDDDAPAFEG